MNIPISGLILLPLTLAVFCFSTYLEEWAIFTAVLQGAALVNLNGGFAVGLSPYFLVAGLIAVSVIPQSLTGRVSFFPDEPARQHVRLLVLFVAWCTFSAFALPILFKAIPVDSPRAGVDNAYYNLIPLRWSFSNAGQAGYMVLNFILVLRLLQLGGQPGRIDRLINAFSWSGIFVAGVGFYQMVCPWFGRTFPTWLFNSNKVWAEAPNQLIGTAGGFSRVTATFVEPSDAAAFLAAWSIFELSLAISGGRGNTRHWLAAAAGSVLLVGTASTTGYVIAALMWAIITWDCVATMFRYGVIKIRATLASLGLASGALVAVILLPGAWRLLNLVVFEKGTSASALHRTATFAVAAKVFLKSWGLGVGLGSNRAMSAFFYILSNLGLPGVVFFGWLLAQLYVQVLGRLKNAYHDPTERGYLYAIAGAFTANLVALVVSGAEITQPHLWILWGLLLATVRYYWLQEHEVPVAVAANFAGRAVVGYVDLPASRAW